MGKVFPKEFPAFRLITQFEKSFGVWKCGQTRSFVFDILLQRASRFIQLKITKLDKTESLSEPSKLPVNKTGTLFLSAAG